MRFSVHIILLAALFLSVPGHADEPRHRFQEVPMTDGKKLATDVYLPAEGDGPWPVVLVRSTYGRAPKPFTQYTGDGAAVVVQDVRGMGESEGAKHVFYAEGWRPDQHDGADTAGWIRAQPWCDGHIGTVGASALAMTQALLAPSTPHLNAQVLEMVPTDFYHHSHYHGGVFRKNMILGWHVAIMQPKGVDEIRAHPFDDEFWTWYDTNAQAEKIHAPGLFIGGWYDIFSQGTIEGFLAREEHGAAGARGNNYLIMKWSSHGQDVSKDYRFNENRYDLKVSQLRRKFLDRYLFGETEALEGVAKVHYYVMGDDTAPDAPGNEWRTAEAWPPYLTVETPYYLHADGALGDARPGPDAAALSYAFDPADPCPTLGGPNLLPNLPAGPFDQRALRASRDDVLAFEGPLLEAPLEITGRVRVQLWVSSDAPDTDFTAKLVDVFPDGREINVLDGIRRVKTRNGFAAPAPLLTSTEEIVALEIDLWSTAWVFNTGHRIGLHISSSNYPRFELNPNTGDDFPGEGAPPRIARNTVHMDRTHASALVLPVRAP